MAGKMAQESTVLLLRFPPVHLIVPFFLTFF